jgi:hypothetical protein
VINSGYASIPVWEGLDAPDWASYTAQLADALDPHLLQFVADLAERNTRLADAPVGTVAIKTPDGTVWCKADTGWVTWWEPLETWRTLTLDAQYSVQTPCQVRRVGNVAYLRGRANHDDNNIPLNGSKVATVPSDCIPTQICTQVIGLSLVGTNEVSAARLEVYGASNSTSLGGPGTVSIWLGVGQENVPWTALDCYYWLD